MSKKILQQIKKIIQTKDNISLNTKLDDIEQWDSLSILNFIGFAEQAYKKNLSGNDIAKCKCVGDLVKLLG